MTEVIRGILKSGTNEPLQNRNRIKETENKLMLSKGKKKGGINWKIETDIHTPLYIK